MAESPVSRFRRLPLEHWLLLGTLLVFPFDKIFAFMAGSTVQESEGITVSYLLMAMLLAAVGGRAIINRDTRLLQLPLSSPVTILIIAHILVSLLSALVAKNPFNAVGAMISRTGLFVFYIVILHLVRDRWFLKVCLLAFVISAVAACAAGYYEMATGQPVIEEYRYSDTIVRTGLHTESTGAMRIQGLSPEPDKHGATLMIQLGALLALVMLARRWWVWAAGAMLVLSIMMNIAATAARSAWAGMFGVMAGFLILAPLRRKPLVLGIAGATLVLSFIVAVIAFPNLAIMDRLLGRKDVGSFSTKFRYEMLLISWEMGKESPLLGVGTGSFTDEYHKAVRVSSFLPRKTVYVPHNVYGGIFAENGILGLVVYCLLHAAVVMQLVLCWRGSPDREARMIAAGLAAGFAGFVYSLNWYPMWGSKYGWTIMAFTGAFYLILRKERSKLRVAEGMEPQLNTARLTPAS